MRPLQGILDKFSKFIDFHVVITENQNKRKYDNAEEYSLVYIFFIFNFQNVVQLFCCHFRGRYSDKFTCSTSVLWEVSEVIEKISTSRIFLELLKLFLGPDMFMKRFKNCGYTVLILS